MDMISEQNQLFILDNSNQVLVHMDMISEQNVERSVQFE